MNNANNVKIDEFTDILLNIILITEEIISSVDYNDLLNRRDKYIDEWESIDVPDLTKKESIVIEYLMNYMVDVNDIMFNLLKKRKIISKLT